MSIDFAIDPDITRAQTPPARFYLDPAIHALMRERVLAPSWHLYPEPLPHTPGALVPWTLFDEPLLLAHDGEQLRCVSNVCTHRGAILVESACEGRAIRCPYHGRRFGLDGRCRAVPGFEDAAGVPSASDDLPAIAFETFHPLGFASLAPRHPLAALLAPVRERIGWLPLARAVFDAASSRRYSFDASWLLYCDNYLEGFHIPYVHKALARTLALDGYQVVLWPHGSLQIGIAADGEPALEPPAGHPDHGRRVAGYYFWLFPSTLINVYPWGLSVNVIIPEGSRRTHVQYLTYVWDEDGRGRGAGSGLERVEHEDEEVVLRVERGLRARLYHRGRYAPRHERAVHHFHRLVCDALAQPS